jgi:hypothetical protein
MHKSHTGDRAAVLLGKRVVGIAKPIDDLQESVQRTTWQKASHTFLSTQLGTPVSSPVG